jgi:phosphate transport system permease protein
MERRISYFKQKGDSYVFAASMGLIISLAMVFWIVLVILFKGLSFFWPHDTVEVKLQDSTAYLGEQWEERSSYQQDSTGKEIEIKQIQLKIGNRDIYGRDFVWIKQANIVSKEYPPAAVTFERREYGNFYGFIQSVHIEDKQFGQQTPDLMDKALETHNLALENRKKIKETEAKISKLTEPLTRLQREISLLNISAHSRTEEGKQKLVELQEKATRMEADIAAEYQMLNSELEKRVLKGRSIYLEVATADGKEKTIYLADVVRFFQPNKMGTAAKVWHYAAKLWEFVSAEPRESNTEGGVFPAIFGTVVMVLLMSIAVVPFGVMTAIYLNEYAKQGTVIRFIRLSVNNLAGVPSIVFGVFGLGFFIYIIGGSIDQLFFSDKLPEPTFGTGGILWASLTLALLTLPVVVVATEEGLLAVPRANKEGALALGSTRWQMIRKVVLPNAMPGILTGLILAISRGAGEVAPLMITGVVKLAPTLPLDTTFPFLHLDRKFMHLGFHIYDVGFQSPNVEAAKPMVYSTALLLILIVVLLNLIAIYFRNRLRKKYKSSTF